MTLALYVDDADISEPARERVRALAEKHPSRVIMWDATQASGIAHTDASITQSEWIDLGARESSPADLSAALDAFALPNVPLVALWGAREGVTSERFSAFTARANSIICDTSLARNTIGALRELAAVCARNEHRAIADLAYLRLTSWQDCVASFFDDPAVSVDLQNISRVDVTCGPGAEGHYVLGWLASRLGWSPSSPTAFTGPAGTVAFSLEHGGEPRRINSIEITCGDTRYRAELDAADANTIVFEGNSGKTRSRSCRAMSGTDMATLVENAVLLREVDPVFRESLAIAGAIQTQSAT